MKPIFIFTLPRSGSTLLQRVLMGHSKISSAPEPWIMLPIIYSLKDGGILSEYGAGTAKAAISDFIDNGVGGREDYLKLLKQFVLGMYSTYCKNSEIYFLDKTPRYHLVISEIVEIFPDAKFVFLVRDPHHIISSISNTWAKGRLRKLYPYMIDLDKGVHNISNGIRLLGDRSLIVSFEQFVRNPYEEVKTICSYLDIEFEEHMLTAFSNEKFSGRMGDPNGVKAYNSVDQAPLYKWKSWVNSNYRKKLLTRYIRSLNDDDLGVQGCSKNKILAEIDSVCPADRFSIGDRVDFLFSQLIKIVKFNIWFGKRTSKWAKRTYLH